MTDAIHICGKCRKKKAQPQYTLYDGFTGLTFYFCFYCYLEWLEAENDFWSKYDLD